MYDPILPRLPGYVQGNVAEPSDWAELYNNETVDLNLSNYSLTDNTYLPRKWVHINPFVTVDSLSVSKLQGLGLS